MSIKFQPVCVSCKQQFVPLKNEVVVVETSDSKPWRLWAADLWHCPTCDHRIIQGFGNNPLADAHLEPDDFDHTFEQYQQMNRPIFFCPTERGPLSTFDGVDHLSKEKKRA